MGRDRMETETNDELMCLCGHHELNHASAGRCPNELTYFAREGSDQQHASFRLDGQEIWMSLRQRRADVWEALTPQRRSFGTTPALAAKHLREALIDDAKAANDVLDETREWIDDVVRKKVEAMPITPAPQVNPYAIEWNAIVRELEGHPMRIVCTASGRWGSDSSFEPQPILISKTDFATKFLPPLKIETDASLEPNQMRVVSGRNEVLVNNIGYVNPYAVDPDARHLDRIKAQLKGES